MWTSRMRFVSRYDEGLKTTFTKIRTQNLDAEDYKKVESFDSILSKSSETGSYWLRSHTSKGLSFTGIGISWCTPEMINAASEIRLGP